MAESSDEDQLRFLPISKDAAVELSQNAMSNHNDSIRTSEDDSGYGEDFNEDASIIYVGNASQTLAMAFVEGTFPNDYALHALWGYHSQSNDLPADVFASAVEAFASTFTPAVLGERPQELHVYVAVAAGDNELTRRLTRAHFARIGDRTEELRVVSYRRTVSPAKGAA